MIFRHFLLSLVLLAYGPSLQAGTITPNAKDDWTRMGWSMAYIKACSTNYDQWRETQNKIKSLREQGKIAERHYQTIIRQVGRTAGAIPTGCKKSKNAKTLEAINGYLDRL